MLESRRAGGGPGSEKEAGNIYLSGGAADVLWLCWWWWLVVWWVGWVGGWVGGDRSHVGVEAGGREEGTSTSRSAAGDGGVLTFAALGGTVSCRNSRARWRLSDEVDGLEMRY